VTPDDKSLKEDELLVIRCQLGERPAFDELVGRWHRPLHNYVGGLTQDNDAAGDVLQDTWVRVLRGIDRLRDGTRLRPWLFGIARRAAMDRLRQRYSTPVDLSADMEEVEAISRDDFLTEQLDVMEDELARLPIVERDVLTLFYLQELSLADVADVLGIPVGTVKSRLFRARQLLRRAIEKEASRS